MRLRTLFGITVLAALCSTTGAALAQSSPELISSERDWSVFRVEDASGRTCYAASEPTKQEGNFSRRDQPAMMVARLPGQSGAEQVSVQPGYGYKKDSGVEVVVEGRRFDLFTQGEHAWTRTEGDDRALIEAMRAGSALTVRGTSTRGTYSLDTYSLLGFTAAVNALRNACAS